MAALDIAGAGHNLYATATWLAVVLALAVAAPGIFAALIPWLLSRIRFVRRKWTVSTLAATPAGAWRRSDPAAIQGLTALELRSAGIAVKVR